MKKRLNKALASVKKVLKKVFTKKLVLSIIVPVVVLGFFYLIKSLIFVAWVNGRPIYRLTLVKELEKQGGSQIMDSLIEKSLILNEAKKNSIEVTQSEIDIEIKKIEEMVSAQGISLDEALKFRNQTRKDLNDQIKVQKIVEKLLSSKIVLKDDEVKDYFNKNKSLFGQNPVFDKVVDQVKAQLYQQKLTEEYTTWIKDLKDKAKIHYFVKY